MAEDCAFFVLNNFFYKREVFMKNHKWFAALAVMVMVLAVAGCSNPSSGNESTSGSSGGSGNSSGQVTVELTTTNIK